MKLSALALLNWRILAVALLSIYAGKTLAWSSQTLPWPASDARPLSQLNISPPCQDCLLELRLPIQQRRSMATGFIYLSTWRGQQLLGHYTSIQVADSANELRVLAWAPPDTEHLQLSFVRAGGSSLDWGKAQLAWLPQDANERTKRKSDYMLQKQLQRIEQQAWFAPKMGWDAWYRLMTRMSQATNLRDRNMVLQFGLNLLSEPVPHSRITPAIPKSAIVVSGSAPEMQLEWLAPRIAYLALPQYGAPQARLRQTYADRLGELLQQAHGACGLILDLRANGGGAIGPPLAGLSPLFEDGQVLGWWQSSQGSRRMLRLSHGAYQELANGKLEQDIALSSRWRLSQTELPLALLIGPHTASAAEILSTLLQQRTATNSFGESSAGQMNGVSNSRLPDGANLHLVTHVLLAPDGTQQPLQFQPNNTTTTPLQSAIEWLQSPSNCAINK